ncbi:MAG: hypothetical protein LBR73_09060 [Oscillospiraceae bacterium]|jgi:hypothetical protein|nr:hypothetical protein [Oscillospiraceae bacterium]
MPGWISSVAWLETVKESIGSGSDFMLVVTFIVSATVFFFAVRSRRMNTRLQAPPTHRPVMDFLKLHLPSAAQNLSEHNGKPQYYNAIALVKEREKTASQGKPLSPAQAELYLLRRNAVLFIAWATLAVERWVTKPAVRKLRLLPAEDNRQRANVLLAVLVCVCGSIVVAAYNQSAFVMRLGTARGSEEVMTWALWSGFLGTIGIALFTIVPFLLVKKNRLLYFDIAGAYMVLMMSFFKFFICADQGCCQGIPWEGGVYNEMVKAEVFPIQVVEGFAWLLGFMICVAVMLSRKYKPGTGCAVAACSYAIPRFFSDNYRYRTGSYHTAETHGIFGLSIVQNVCIIAVLLSIAWLLLLPVEKKILDRIRDDLAGAAKKTLWRFATYPERKYPELKPLRRTVK